MCCWRLYCSLLKRCVVGGCLYCSLQKRCVVGGCLYCSLLKMCCCWSADTGRAGRPWLPAPWRHWRSARPLSGPAVGSGLWRHQGQREQRGDVAGSFLWLYTPPAGGAGGTAPRRQRSGDLHLTHAPSRSACWRVCYVRRGRGWDQTPGHGGEEAGAATLVPSEPPLEFCMKMGSSQAISAGVLVWSKDIRRCEQPGQSKLSTQSGAWVCLATSPVITWTNLTCPLPKLKRISSARPLKDTVRVQARSRGGRWAGLSRRRWTLLRVQARSRGGRWCWTHKLAQKRSRVGRWSWAWNLYFSASAVVSQQRSYGHCLCDRSAQQLGQ